MGNPIQDKSKFERCIVSQCCFFFTLRAGTLIIGIFQIVVGILWFIGGGAGRGGAFAGILSGILMLLAGIFVLLALRKGAAKYLWISVYITIAIGIWLLISAIILFATFFIGLAIGALLNMLCMFYFSSVLRSYAFELESAPAETTNPA